MPHRLVHVISSSHCRVFARAALIAAVLALSGCATGALGGYPQGGQSPGSSYPGQQYPQQYPANQLIGTVQGVDAGAGRILLNTQSSTYGGGGSRVEVYFDQRTQLAYQGQVYPVDGLEPGDEIRVDASQSGGRLWARSIEVLRNVRDGQGGAYGQGGGYSNSGDLRGEVGFVDTRSRTIELARGAVGGNYGAVQRIRYDERTLVEYQG